MWSDVDMRAGFILLFLCLTLSYAVPSTDGTSSTFAVFRDFYLNSCGPHWSGAYISDCGFRETSQCWNISAADANPCDWFGIRCRGTEVVAVLFQGFDLCGSFPVAFSNLSLVNVDLSDNMRLSGPLPPDFAQLFPSVKTLTLSKTSISGSLRPLSSLSLQFVDVHQTLVTEMPMPFPASIIRFVGADARLSGCLPAFPVDSQLSTLHVDRNKLSCGIENLQGLHLDHLGLSSNEFAGPLPRNWTTLCSTLQNLDLSDNSFHGPVPDISSCDVLRTASFAVNRLSGSLDVLGDLLKRRHSARIPLTISFRNNHFSGDFNFDYLVPRSNPILASLDISENLNLTGALDSFAVANIRGFELLPLWIDARFTQIKPAATDVLSAFKQSEWDINTYKKGGFSCYALTDFDFGGGSVVIFRFPPPFLNYSNCFCIRGKCGKPPNCVDPPPGGTCTVGEVMEFPRHLYPVYLAERPEFPIAFETCPLKADGSSACKGGSVEYGITPTDHALCDHGAAKRMCTECEKGFFRIAEGCRPCEAPSLAVSIVFGVGGAFLLGIFLIPTKRSNWFLLIAELSVTLVLVFIGGLGEAYIINVLVMVVVFQFVELLHFSRAGTGVGGTHGLPVVGSLRVTVSGILKVALYYFQFTSMLNEDIWPESLAPVLNAINSGALVATGPECTHWFEAVGFDDELGSLVKTALMPIMLLLVVVLMLLGKSAIRYARNRCKGVQEEHQLLLSEEAHSSSNEAGHHQEHAHQPSTWQQIASVASFITFAVYMEISVTILEVFKCEAAPDGIEYLVKKPFYACIGHEYHILNVAAIVLFIVFVVGVPVMFSLLLFKYRKRLHNHDVEYVLGFLYESYKPEFAWWEVVQFARRFLLIMLYNFFPSQSSTVQSFIILVLLISAVVTIEIKPYAFALEAFLDVTATLIILVTHAIRSIVKLEQLLLEQVSAEGDFSSLPGIWIAACLNIAFIVLLLSVWGISGLRVIFSALRKRYFKWKKKSRQRALNN